MNTLLRPYETENNLEVKLLLFLLFTISFMAFMLIKQDQSNNEKSKPTIYQLEQISTETLNVTNKISEKNSIISQFFLGTIEKTQTGQEKIINLKYVIKTKKGLQLKNFEKEFHKTIYDDNVYFKESKKGKAEIKIEEIETNTTSPDYKITFYIPKENIQEILSKL